MSFLIKQYLLRFLALGALALLALPVHAADIVTYFHLDALGSPVAATDQQGNVVWREDYEPYGNRIKNEAAAQTNTHWYTGHPHDSSTGLTYIGARYYDPTLGRFMAIDPKDFAEGNPHSFNRYAYGNNNPYRYTDPDGRSPLDVGFFLYDLGGAAVSVYTGVGVGPALIDLGISAVGLLSPVPGTGLAIKAGRAVDKAIVIGEDMDRVRAAAQKLGAETFEGKGMDANRAWIRAKKEQGYEVNDVGPAFDRRVERKLKGQQSHSDAYGMERQETKDYPTNKLWEREGKYQGGSSFLGE